MRIKRDNSTNNGFVTLDRLAKTNGLSGAEEIIESNSLSNIDFTWFLLLN